MKQAFAATNENIQLLADRFEISNLLLDLATAIDNKDVDALDDIFTPDAFIDYTAGGGIKGKYPDLKTFLAQASPHLISSANIRIDGDAASGSTLCRVSKELAGQARCYVDSFRRTDRGWRIVQRLQEPVCPGQGF